jgi:hypothetical protein
MTLFSILLFLLLAAVGVFAFLKVKKKLLTTILPSQLAVVRQLLKELNETGVRMLPSQKAVKIKLSRLSLKKASRLIDSDTELAGEEFDDDRIFFNSNEPQLFNVKTYLESELLPKEIHEELVCFHNTEYIPANIDNEAYFVFMNVSKDSEEPDKRELFEGNGEAYESWLNFKEHTNNLFYLVRQWLKENSGPEFETIRKPVVE